MLAGNSCAATSRSARSSSDVSPKTGAASHLVANEVVRRCTGEEVEITALLFLHERQPDGQYRLQWVLDTTQTFRRSDEGWRITRRSTTPLHPLTSTRG